MFSVNYSICNVVQICLPFKTSLSCAIAAQLYWRGISDMKSEYSLT